MLLVIVPATSHNNRLRDILVINETVSRKMKEICITTLGWCRNKNKCCQNGLAVA